MNSGDGKLLAVAKPAPDPEISPEIVKIPARSQN